MRTNRMSFAIISLLTVIGLLSSSPSAFALEVQEHLLANGMKVLLVESPKAPVVTVQIWYKVGSRNEVMGRAGLSHMLEHMMFKGTPKYPKGEFSRLVKKNGGHDNAFTGQDFTAYFENLAADRVELALELEADRLRGLLLDEKEFQLEREVVKEERRLRSEDDPQSYLAESLFAQAFQMHPYHWPIIGWFPDLNAMTRADLKKHYDTYYVPNNATLIVVGDFISAKLLPLIKHHFEAIPKRPLPPQAAVTELEQKGERRFVVKRDAQLPFVMIGYKVPNYSNDDAYALTILESILSHGKSSRLYRNLVYEQKLALAIGADYSLLQTDPGLLYVFGTAAPGQTPEQVERAVYAEIEKLQQAPPTEQELQRAQNQVEATHIFGQDSNFRQAMLMGQAETTGAGWKQIELFVKKLRDVKTEDVQRVAKKYLVEDTRTVGILIPTPMNRMAEAN